MAQTKASVAKPVLCIVGPTGVGKSEVAVRVGREVGGEVVSADSMQVYRGMDIGTAKLSQGEMAGVAHHCLDLVDPSVRFTVADWVRCADAAITDIHRRGRLPIVVGGTGLYIRAVVEDLDFAEHAGSADLREKWQAFAQEHGAEALHLRLQKVDPGSAARLHSHDVRRVIRALEVADLKRTPLSESYDWTDKGGRYNARQVGLYMDRFALYARIDARVERMLRQGLLREVESLLRSGLHASDTAMQAIGYKEWVSYMEGTSLREDAAAAIKRNTRRLAKRQLSWFLRDRRIEWHLVRPDGTLPETDFFEICEAARALSAGISTSSLE